MVQALLQDELPTLVKEIKATPTFTDFFGLWRRDVELSRKAQHKPDTDRTRSSFSNSIRSVLPLSPSSLSAKLLSPTKGKARAQIPISSASSTHSDSSLEERPSRSSDRGQEIRSMKSRASSSTSHSSSSLPSTPITTSRQLPSTSQQPVIVSPEVSIRFGHSPHALGSERYSFSLESLPEDREFSSSPKSDLDIRSRRRAGSTSHMNRNARVYAPPRSDPLESYELSCKRFRSFSGSDIHHPISTLFVQVLQSFFAINALLRNFEGCCLPGRTRRGLLFTKSYSRAQTLL